MAYTPVMHLLSGKYLRKDIYTALRRDVRVIPVLVDNATMPHSIDLPEDLKPLARRNAIEISHTRFSMDVERLIRAIELAFSQIGVEETAEGKSIAKKPKQKPQWKIRLAQSFTSSVKNEQGYKTSSNSIWSTVSACALGGAMGYIVGSVLWMEYIMGFRLIFNFYRAITPINGQIVHLGRTLVYTAINGLIYGALAGLILAIIFRKKIKTSLWVQALLAVSFISSILFSNYIDNLVFSSYFIYPIIPYLIYVIFVSVVIHWLRTLKRSSK